jgi:hypothetical protein
MEPRATEIMDSAAKLVSAAGGNIRTLVALGLIAACVIGVVYFRSPAAVSQTVGNDSVVMGNVSPNAKIGNGSVVIGATDARGNTIITQPMAVGRGAYAGPGSIAIGAGAGAGMRPSDSGTGNQPASGLNENPAKSAE